MEFHGINHVVLKVKDLEESDRFYRGVLGLEISGRREGMIFYTAGLHPHDLALVEAGPSARRPGPQSTGLFHFCLDVTDESDLERVYGRCREAGARLLGAVDHVVMKSFYVADPDGNVVEIGVDAPRKEWEAMADPFARDYRYEIGGSKDRDDRQEESNEY